MVAGVGCFRRQPAADRPMPAGLRGGPCEVQHAAFSVGGFPERARQGAATVIAQFHPPGRELSRPVGRDHRPGLMVHVEVAGVYLGAAQVAACDQLFYCLPRSCTGTAAPVIYIEEADGGWLKASDRDRHHVWVFREGRVR